MKVNTLPPPCNQGPSARSVTAVELADFRRRRAAPWAVRHVGRRYGVPLPIAHAVCEAAGFAMEGR